MGSNLGILLIRGGFYSTLYFFLTPRRKARKRLIAVCKSILVFIFSMMFTKEFLCMARNCQGWNGYIQKHELSSCLKYDTDKSPSLVEFI